MSDAELERFIAELAQEAGLPLEETRSRFCDSLQPDAELEAAIERMERRVEQQQPESPETETWRSQVEQATERVQAAIDRLIQAAPRAIEAMRGFGVTVGSGAQAVATTQAIAESYVQHEEAAQHLAILTPLTPEQARSPIREHGLGFAQRVGELVARGWSLERAVGSLAGQHGRLSELSARFDLGDDMPEAMFDSGALQVTPPRHPRDRCAPSYFQWQWPTVRRGPQRGSVGKADGPYCKRDRPHGTPSSFAEVCGDAAVTLHQPVLTPCAACRNHDDNPYLSCAVHPLGRTGHECGDWEAMKPGSERLEARTFVNGVEQVVWVQGVDRADQVTHESVEEEWETVYYSGERTQQVLVSRTRYRHYADGSREVVPEEPVQMPRLSQPWERPGYRWVTAHRVRIECNRDLCSVAICGFPSPTDTDILDGGWFGIRVTGQIPGVVPMVRWCPIAARLLAETPPGWTQPYRWERQDDLEPEEPVQLPPQTAWERRAWERYGWLI